MFDDLRQASRTLTKSPVFSAVAILTFALGIGANTAIFSIVDTVVLRPLPYSEPEHLVQIAETNLRRDVSFFSVSVPNYVDWRERSRSWTALAARRTRSANLAGGDAPEHVWIQAVSANYLPLLGVPPSLGRHFREEEDQPGRNAVAILTNGLWKRRFGADPTVIGQTIVLSGTAHTVVGVAPAVPGLDDAGEAFVPLAADLTREERDDHDLDVFGRLAPGVTIEQASTEMTTIARRIGQENPDSNAGWGVRLVPLFSAVVGEPVRKALLILLGAVGLLLIIACANVANLLLLRATTRSREMAIRVALGSSLGRLGRQLLAESLLLAGLGGLAGTALALWIVDLVRALAPADLPRAAEIAVDARVLGFTCLVIVAAGILAGFAPIGQAARADVQRALKENRPTAAPGRWSTRNNLVVGQVALSLVLVVGAGLLLRSLHRLSRVEMGFRGENVLTLRLAPGGDAHAFYRRLEERAAALPHVQAVGLSSGIPLTPFNTSLHVFPVGPAKIPPSDSVQASWRVVDAGFFQTLQIPLLRGRFFEEGDGKMVLVNQALARALWGDEDPVGKPVNPGGGTDYSTVLGVVGDFRMRNPYQAPEPAFFYSAHRDLWGEMTLVVRTATSPEPLVPELRAVVRSLDPGLPVFHVATMDELRGASLSRHRDQAVLFGSFAALAVLLAGVGVSGVVGFAVAQRTREIGIRIALGGSRGDIRRLVGGFGSRLAIPGLVFGLAGSLALARVFEGLLFEVSPWDLWTYTSALLLAGSMALVACAVPARKAARVDPMVALREE